MPKENISCLQKIIDGKLWRNKRCGSVIYSLGKVWACDNSHIE